MMNMKISKVLLSYIINPSGGSISPNYNPSSIPPVIAPITSPFGDLFSSSSLITNAFNLFYFVVGLVFLILIIISGIKIITSNGNKEKFGGAQKTLTYAIIGLVIIILAGVVIKIISTIFPIFGGLI